MLGRKWDYGIGHWQTRQRNITERDEKVAEAESGKRKRPV
jgi:hypothetical protein